MTLKSFSGELRLYELEPADPIVPDIQCRNCDSVFSVHWDNDPLFGDHNGFCPSCGRILSITVKPQYTAT